MHTVVQNPFRSLWLAVVHTLERARSRFRAFQEGVRSYTQHFTALHSLVGCQETPSSGAHPSSATTSPPRGTPTSSDTTSPHTRRASNQKHDQSDKGRAASGKRQRARQPRPSARKPRPRARAACFPAPPRPPQLATTDLRWSLWQSSLNIPTNTKSTRGVVGLTVLQPKFLEQFPNARFHFKSGPLAQRGTFKGVWLDEDEGVWALERRSRLAPRRSRPNACAFPCRTAVSGHCHRS
jgi:hypothetical protein